MSCRPGHPPRHPPFEPGNVVSLKHGAGSARAVAARADQVHESLLEYAPWLDEAHFAPAVQRYLSAAAVESLLDDYVRAVSAEKGAGAVGPRVFEQLTAARRLAARLGETLGLDPFAFSRLKAVAASAEVTAMSLAELSESGRRIRLSAEARLAEVDDVGTDELVDDEFDDDEDET